MKLSRTRLDRFVSLHTDIAKNSIRLLIAQKKITINGLLAHSANQTITPFDQVNVTGKMLPHKTARYVVLHKPKGVVSATRDDKNQTVLDIIQHPHKDELHIAGRLDFNTTGLMLLSNDGFWTRHLSLPELCIQKHYLVTTADPITEQYRTQFLAGIDFNFEGITTKPAVLTIINSHQAELALTEGRYHQVKRMFGFFNNTVTQLHRFAIGPLHLPANLAPGNYAELTQQQAYSMLKPNNSNQITPKPD
ncbi:pseudouridine synthase [Marinagarivorans algicola]|uniref:pseudouridine synthase n=1 Tax=Marinagarivorans algicola TaxID=1513270 RepID=UPI0037359191